MTRSRRNLVAGCASSWQLRKLLLGLLQSMDKQQCGITAGGLAVCRAARNLVANMAKVNTAAEDCR